MYICIASLKHASLSPLFFCVSTTYSGDPAFPWPENDWEGQDTWRCSRASATDLDLTMDHQTRRTKSTCLEKKPNPTRPDKCMGQSQAKFFYPKPRKKLTQPNLEITHEKLDFTQPDLINDSRETRRWSQEESANNQGRACGYVRTCCTGSVRVPPASGPLLGRFRWPTSGFKTQFFFFFSFFL